MLVRFKSEKNSDFNKSIENLYFCFYLDGIFVPESGFRQIDYSRTGKAALALYQA